MHITLKKNVEQIRASKIVDIEQVFSPIFLFPTYFQPQFGALLEGNLLYTTLRYVVMFSDGKFVRIMSHLQPTEEDEYLSHYTTAKVLGPYLCCLLYAEILSQ